MQCAVLTGLRQGGRLSPGSVWPSQRRLRSWKGKRRVVAGVARAGAYGNGQVRARKLGGLGPRASRRRSGLGSRSCFGQPSSGLPEYIDDEIWHSQFIIQLRIELQLRLCHRRLDNVGDAEAGIKEATCICG